MIKTKRFLSIAFLLMGAMLFLFGCAEDKDPLQPTAKALELLLQNPTGTVVNGGYVSYKWEARHGAGGYSFSYTFTGHPDVNNTSDTKATFENLAAGQYTFSVTATDAKSATVTKTSETITVGADAQAPTVNITFGPALGTEVAEGNSVTFSWEGNDASTFGSIVGYTYKFVNAAGTYTDTTTGLVQVTSVTFDSLTSGTYTLTIGVEDNSGFTTEISTSFDVRPANIVWIDDYYQGDDLGEFRERQNEWSVALEGFAWREYDITENFAGHASTLPIISGIINTGTVETVIWDVETTYGPYELWFATNGGADSVLIDFLDNGGNVVLVGGGVMDLVYDAGHIPAPGDFEATYMGINTFADTTITTTWDTTLVEDPPGSGNWVPVYTATYDTSYTVPWDYDDYVTMTGTAGYTNISIDVGKDADTQQGNTIHPGLDAAAVPIILDDDTGETVAYVYDIPDPRGKMVVLPFNLYFSPANEIQSLINQILTQEFGH